MIDTVALRQIIKMPSPDALVEREFIPLRKNLSSLNSLKFVYNPPTFSPNLPRLTWSTAPNGLDYLTAEVSIPRFFHGTNTILLKNDKEIYQALNSLSKVVSLTANTEFNANNAIVGRVDFCHDIYKPQDEIVELLKSLQGHTISRMHRVSYDNNSVYFKNRSQQIVCYSKYTQIKQLVLKKEATEEDLARAQNIFRLEVRFCSTQSSKRLTSRLNLRSRNACDLLQNSVAKRVLKEAIHKLGLDRSVETSESRLKILRDKYGMNTTYMRLAGFISVCDEHGIENLVRLGVIKPSTLRLYRKKIREAGIVLSTRRSEKLNPLTLTL